MNIPATVRVPWDKASPLFDSRAERSILDQESLRSYLLDIHANGQSLGDVVLEVCTYEYGPNFDIRDLLEDYVCDEDFDWDSESVKDINAKVNNWIDDHGPYSLHCTGKYVEPDSLQPWWPSQTP